MDNITRALAELRKTLFENTITAIDEQANVQALKATVLELGGQAAVEAFERHHEAERNRLAALRGSFVTGVGTLQTILDRSPRPDGPVH